MAAPSQAMIDIARSQAEPYDWVNGEWVKIPQASPQSQGTQIPTTFPVGPTPVNNYTPDDFSAKTLMDAYTSSVGPQAPGGNVPGFPQNPPPPPGDMDYNIDPSAGLVPTLDGEQVGLPEGYGYQSDDWFNYMAMQDPRAIMRSTLGIPTLGQTPYEEWIMAQAGMMRDTWLAAQMMGTQVGGIDQQPRLFSDYLTSSNPSQSRQLGANLYGSMGGLGNQASRDLTGLLGTSGIQNLAYQNLASQYSPQVAAYYAGAVPSLEGEYGISRDPAEGRSFIEWLMNNNPYF